MYIDLFFFHFIKMKWSTLGWIALVIFAIVLFTGFMVEQKQLRTKYSKESFRFRLAVDTCQEKIQKACEGLYPQHLTGLTKDEIQTHPDFQLYQECLETARKETC